MISCLTLVRYSHIRVALEGSRSVTACGLAIEAAHISDGMFAADAVDATCPSCQATATPNQAAAVVPGASVETFARWFVECVVGANQPCDLSELLSPEIADVLTRARIQRLHALFPALGMTVDEVVAQGPKAVVRYTATCRDQSGLIGAAGETLTLRQALILEYVGGRITRIDPLVDDLALWPFATSGRGVVP
jgi:SnoaL-like polyketide cyclase